MNEYWVVIPGFDDYEISNHAHIRYRLDASVNRPMLSRPKIRFLRDRSVPFVDLYNTDGTGQSRKSVRKLMELAFSERDTP